MNMRKYILLLVFFVVGFTAQAQVLVRVNGEHVTFENDKLTQITSSYNQINFVCKSGYRMSFDIRELKSLNFAEEAADVDSLPAGETTIVYDRKNDIVYVVNGAKNATLNVYTAEGVIVKRAKGNNVDMKGIVPGLYIVSYNNKINAKILRK